MLQRIIRSVLTVATLAFAFATIVLAQSADSREALATPIAQAWRTAQSTGPSKGKLLVIALDQPNRRQTCQIQSFAPDKLVCSRAFGGTRTYLPQQVLALILPGNEYLRIPWLIGFNSGAGAAIWGTVVLAAACPICAAATSVAAVWCLGEAGVGLSYGDYRKDRILYLAPGESLGDKYDSVDPRPSPAP